ncbi:uncharacterized protein LOC133205638 [Saccostrea echinata]|uniref:uncharacterized protein LOC133205638 n=1 Tax=Saccostrea echinata TaxID=191078 RepID=UPI002A822CE7|nr:uncharacterized protein LOC133205638 [Saccostrea echinata]
MATASWKFLPYGKRYHIFFFHGSSERDCEWIRDIIEQIESQRYICGCTYFDFKSHLSFFDNIGLVVKQAVVIAFILSHESTKSEVFLNLVDNAAMYILRQKREKPVPMIPVLLDDCEIPQCLISYEPLVASDERNHWWPKLMNVLDIENSSWSGGESDKKLKYHFNCIMEEIKNDSSMEKEKQFQKLLIESGIVYYTGQFGSRKTAKILRGGCGIKINSQSLVIEWEMFVNIMSKSEEALIEIEALNKEVKIKNIIINLTKEGEDKLLKYCVENLKKIVKFFEHSLNYDFYKTEYDRMTYNVDFQGHTGYDLLNLANNLARNLYLGNFQKRTIEFNSLDKRIKTFDTSPFESEQSNILAKAGFIYSGVSDTITCHCCNQSLFGRFEDDSESVMIAHHSRWNTDCQYLTKNIQFLNMTLHQGIRTSPRLFRQ